MGSTGIWYLGMVLSTEMKLCWPLVNIDRAGMPIALAV
jgi:hypothetical protein